MKTRLTIIGLLVALVAVSTFGAFAYFNSQAQTTATIHSGTLTLQVSGDGTTFGSTTALPWDVSNMAPGDTVEGSLYMKNTGSIGAEQITFEWGNILNNPATEDLAKRIFLTSVKDSTDTADQVQAFIGMADTNNDGKCSLYELAELSGRFKYPFDAVSNGTPFLGAGQTQWLYMKFQFDPKAGNEYQGINLTYNLTVTAEQKAVFP